jgi:hypothetical protein
VCVQAMQTRLTTALWNAEVSVLCSIGLQHLHELGWEWNVFNVIEKKYSLHKADNWSTGSVPSAPGSQLTGGASQSVVAAASRGPGASTNDAHGDALRDGGGGSAERRVEKSGRDLATHFLMDACAPTKACKRVGCERVRSRFTKFFMYEALPLCVVRSSIWCS